MANKAIELLDRYVRARYPIIGVQSHEEARVMAAIMAIAKSRNRKVVAWSLVKGLRQEQPVDAPTNWNPELRFDEETTASEFGALDAILNYQSKNDADAVLFVMKDLHGVLGSPNRGYDPRLVRYLREIAVKFEATMHNMILLSPVVPVPPDLDKTMVLIDWPLPDEEELREILARCEADLPARIEKKLNGNRDQLIQAMRGLTAFEAGSVLLSSIAAVRELSEACIPLIVKEKAQIIKKSGILEFYDTTVTMAEVGGLAGLKRYAASKRKVMAAQGKGRAPDAPKGVLLVGVPGTGKSLSAKAIAGGTMPLLRLDVGSLMGGLVGESEGNARQAMKLAEAVAPCVLWLDEVEKALGGVESSAQSDGGTLARVFGTLLTWMQETTAPVYIVATANEARALKPEFIRRFDDMMWVDLPNGVAREQILRVHLKKRGYVMYGMDVNGIAQIVDAMWGFSGAEIEKVVKSAVEMAFFNEVELNGEYLLDAAHRIVPISRTMAERIAEQRAWVAERALMADDPLDERPIVMVRGQGRMSDL